MYRQRVVGPSFETFLETLPGAWFLVRRDNSLAYVNAEAATFLGTTQSELTCFDWNHFTLEQPAERTMTLWERVGDAGNATIPAWQRRKDGALVPVTLLAKRLDVGGEELSLAQAVDRTREVAHEQALEESVELLRSVIDHAPVVVWSLDGAGRIELSEGKGLEGLGLNPGQVVGQSIWELFAQYPSILESARDALKGQSVNATSAIGPLQFDYHYAPHFDRNGNPAGATGVAVDVTRRHRAEFANQQLLAAIEQAAEAVVLTDRQGVVTYVNPAYELTSEYNTEQSIGKAWSTLEIATDAEFIALLNQALTSGAQGSARIRSQQRSGKCFDEEATVSPIRDLSGNILGAVAVKRDVTKQLRWEEQLRQSQKMEAVGQLAGGIAHDFNNLLQIMRGNLELLGNLPLDEYPLQLTDQIAHATDRAAKLVQQLLAFSRKDPVKFVPLRLDRVIYPLLGMLRRLLGEDVEVEWRAGPEVPYICANAPQIEQIVINLCVNARDAMPHGGRLRIGVTCDPFSPAANSTGTVVATEPKSSALPCCVLTIEDDGDGMPQEIRERIFEPFFTTKDVGKGTGLGLATVYAITERHGGSIEVDSELGRGTTFRLHFPTVEGKETPSGTLDTRRAVEGNDRLVLVAEDDPQIRNLTARFLTRAGFRVITAVDGQAAQELILQHEADLSLVILDAIMPHLRGPEVYLRLRERGSKLPCLIVTGYDFHSLEPLPELDRARVLQKPFNGPDLFDNLAQLLEDN